MIVLSMNKISSNARENECSITNNLSRDLQAFYINLNSMSS